MKILFQLFFRLGKAAIFLGLISLVLPFFGLRIRGAAYLEQPGAKLYTILVGVGLVLLAFFVSVMDKDDK